MIDTLSRAIAILEKEMKGRASMMQWQRAGSVVEALKVVVQASSVDFSDAAGLAALVRGARGSDGGAGLDAPGAPAAAAYQSHSGPIVETPEDQKAKAESQLADVRASAVAGR